MEERKSVCVYACAMVAMNLFGRVLLISTNTPHPPTAPSSTIYSPSSASVSPSISSPISTPGSPTMLSLKTL